MFRGHIGMEIRARALFMSEISGHEAYKWVGHGYPRTPPRYALAPLFTDQRDERRNRIPPPD